MDAPPPEAPAPGSRFDKLTEQQKAYFNEKLKPVVNQATVNLCRARPAGEEAALTWLAEELLRLKPPPRVEPAGTQARRGAAAKASGALSRSNRCSHKKRFARADADGSGALTLEELGAHLDMEANAKGDGTCMRC